MTNIYYSIYIFDELRHISVHVIFSCAMWYLQMSETKCIWPEWFCLCIITKTRSIRQEKITFVIHKRNTYKYCLADEWIEVKRLKWLAILLWIFHQKKIAETFRAINLVWGTNFWWQNLITIIKLKFGGVLQSIENHKMKWNWKIVFVCRGCDVVKGEFCSRR